MNQAIQEGFNLTQYLAELARQLDETAHGKRRALIESAASFLGWSAARVYNQLKRRVAWSSGRKPRADKGTTSQPIESLRMVGAMQKQSVRQNGKLVLQLPTAISIAATNGAQIEVSRNQFGRLMRDRRLDARSQAGDRAATSMRSLHPNHVHQVDPSLCLLYYLNGEQCLMRDDQFYKNKLDNYAKVKAKVWRYTLVDHTSSVIIPWYVEAKGESVANLFEFLMFAWGRQPGRPFHGVPRLLIWDKGSANTSHAIRNFFSAIDLKDIPHAKGNPRAKGAVEGANNIVETKFESRLKFEPVQSVEELNEAALRWSNAYNANLIPHEDTRLDRMGFEQPMARFDLWLSIKHEQLRVLPDIDKCRLFLEGKSTTRKVSRRLEISYAHPLANGPRVYDLAGFDGVCAGDTVEVSPLVFGDCEVYVRAQNYAGAPIEYRAKPVAFDPQYGFRADAPVFGEEFRPKPDTEVERVGKELDRIAYPGRTLEAIERAQDKNETPFEGKLVAHSHLRDITVPTSIAARRGSEITMPDRARVEAERMTPTAALIHLTRSFNRKLTPTERAALERDWPDGVTEEELIAWLSATDRQQAVGAK